MFISHVLRFEQEHYIFHEKHTCYSAGTAEHYILLPCETRFRYVPITYLCDNVMVYLKYVVY